MSSRTEKTRPGYEHRKRAMIRWRPSWIFVTSLITAPLFLGIGIWTLRFATRTRDTLQAPLRRRWEFSYRLVGSYRNYHRIVTLGGTDEVEVYAAPWRVRYLRDAISDELWVAEQPGSSELVLTSNAGADLFRAKRRRS